MAIFLACSHKPSIRTLTPPGSYSPPLTKDFLTCFLCRSGFHLYLRRNKLTVLLLSPRSFHKGLWMTSKLVFALNHFYWITSSESCPILWLWITCKKARQKIPPGVLASAIRALWCYSTYVCREPTGDPAVFGSGSLHTRTPRSPRPRPRCERDTLNTPAAGKTSYRCPVDKLQTKKTNQTEGGYILTVKHEALTFDHWVYSNVSY